MWWKVCPPQGRSGSRSPCKRTSHFCRFPSAAPASCPETWSSRAIQRTLMQRTSAMTVSYWFDCSQSENFWPLVNLAKTNWNVKRWHTMTYYHMWHTMTMFGPLVEREIQCFACFAQGAAPLHPLFGLSHTSHEEMQRQFHRNVWGDRLGKKT